VSNKNYPKLIKEILPKKFFKENKGSHLTKEEWK